MAREAFEKLYSIIKRLRGEDGCPWDREQNPLSLRGALVEETYECIEAIEEGDAAHVREELGDVFLLAAMISYMYEEKGEFTVAETLNMLSEKLIRRHPHVFGEVRVKDSAEVLDNWARIKVEKEGRVPRDSILDSVSRAMPPLERADKLQKKAAKAGFDWAALEDVFLKVEEEYREVREEILHSSGQEPSRELEGELGDLLFSVVNLCRFLNVDPSVALQSTNTKFYERFKYVEKRMKEDGIPMTGESIAAMDKYWNEIKHKS
ncbi:MAG: nucleoside triphosphate pyrophosphohydrolase [Spirochaetaceae bacterium]|jgi:tetrapyrrole methylase family protein/MazG family protein|nr:nucleoside triphosphate pyrophosphohydrolase [Spirochaetaceae bacterium]